MGLEVATFLSGLVSSNPVGATDSRRAGDDHIRLMKTVLLATFPDFDQAQAKMKIDATAGPTITDDSADGFRPGSWWIDVTNDRVYVCLDNTAGAAIWAEFSPVKQLGNVQCPYNDLYITRASVSTLTAIASELVLTDATGGQKVFALFSSTINIATAGANGLDTGSEAASTWYHIWAIAKTDGTKAFLLSTSSSAPTMPVGYTYKGYVGAIFNNASSDFVLLNQRGNLVVAHGTSGVFTVLSGGTAGSLTAIDLSLYTPTTARVANISINQTRALTTGPINAIVTSDNQGVVGVGFIQAYLGSGAPGQQVRGQGGVIMKTPQTVYYSDLTANSNPTDAFLLGWEF